MAKRDPKVVTEIMKRVRSQDTKPERRFRSALWEKGVRFRKNDPSILGKPDLSIKKLKLAVFVDGDFWHGNQYRLRGYKSLSRQFDKIESKTYWTEKIKRNRARDRKVKNSLEKEGWVVIRFWESELDSDFKGCVKKTLSTISRLRRRNR